MIRQSEFFFLHFSLIAEEENVFLGGQDFSWDIWTQKPQENKHMMVVIEHSFQLENGLSFTYTEL